MKEQSTDCLESQYTPSEILHRCSNSLPPHISKDKIGWESTISETYVATFMAVAYTASCMKVRKLAECKLSQAPVSAFI